MIIKRMKKWIGILLAYIVLAGLFYFIAGDQIKSEKVTIAAVDTVNSSIELSNTAEVSQELFIEEQAIDKIVLDFTVYYRENNGEVMLELIDKESGEVLAQKEENVSLFKKDLSYEWVMDTQVRGLKNKTVILKIKSDSVPGSAIGVQTGISDKAAIGKLYLNGKNIDGAISCSIVESTNSLFGSYYFVWIFISIILGSIYCLAAFLRERNGKITFRLRFESMWNRYRYLITQLVVRDFKTKYKRSMLGYLWSFLNPLLSMMVQYIVFSRIFRSNIENFPVYLLSGIVLFNFFTDAVGQGLGAIVQNASLITKVYVPKYIYPVTKVVSCSVNLLISVLPLFIVMLLTGQKFTKAILLLPFPLICLLVFCIGMSLMLCSAMVFFRDTQYLWGIISLAWTYATPIFYPAEIIPPKFAIIQKLNPMFHYIRFTRTLLQQGISPGSREYLYCLSFAIGALVLGCLVFKKTQDKFILYI